MTLHSALRVIRLSAIYDLLVTAGFAFTATATMIFDGLDTLHHNLGLVGLTPQATDPVTMMFANLMGSVVLVWALFRILRPSFSAGAADVGARALFSIGMATALLHGASPLALVMLVLEIAWGAVQGGAMLAARRDSTSLRALAASVSPTAAAS